MQYFIQLQKICISKTELFTLQIRTNFYATHSTPPISNINNNETTHPHYSTSTGFPENTTQLALHDVQKG